MAFARFVSNALEHKQSLSIITHRRMMHNFQNKLGVNGLKKQIRSKMKKKPDFKCK